MRQLAERIRRLSESQTLAMAKKSRELQAQGIDIINMSIGEPDFDTPDFIKEAAKKAIDQNYTHYTPVAGYPELRKAISEKFKRDNGLDYPPENIVVSTGAKQSIANAVLSIVNKDDEVIVPVPYWVSYVEMIKLAQGIPVFVPSTVESNFKITPKQLKKHITPRCKLLMFSTPCNPSGSVYTRDELGALAEVLVEYPDIFIISDEIYEHINFAGKHESMAQFGFIRDRVITVNGVSKGFAMTGWRLGYIGATRDVAAACEKMQGQFTSAPSSITQMAAMAAVKAEPSVTHGMLNAFRKRRDIVLDLVKDIPGLKTTVPDGAFYIFPDISHYLGRKYKDQVIGNAFDLSMYLLNIAHVAVVSGEAFGDEKCIRISYATSDDNIVEGIKRIKNALAGLV